jgi:toxin YhaV
MPGPSAPKEAHGWTIYVAAAFGDVLDGLEREVVRLKSADPDEWRSHPKAKILEQVRRLVYDEIPRDPNAAKFLQGNTLGPEHRHWRRAKFMQRFRLFFRFDSATRVIVYGWLNDENTLRKAGSKSDPYSVFLRRLDKGDPPDDWAELLVDAKRAANKKQP